MSLFYAVLLTACFTAICLLILLGDYARRAYIEWRERRDMLIRDARMRKWNLMAFDASKKRARL